ncbi:unnamed protein product [Soboliphyme baturini]|uniref:General transcription and DNA repair factor IIH subunit TFB5 n=1 Tax=Soboliphyme baturini TaxID=241478 RepID=A0A183J989_9BILA|nr:unnamed protein product [Soboliphyme baturini]
MKQFLLHLDRTNALGSAFIIKDLDDCHLFVSAEVLKILNEKIDALMESLSPDLAEK